MAMCQNLCEKGTLSVNQIVTPSAYCALLTSCMVAVLDLGPSGPYLCEGTLLVNPIWPHTNILPGPAHLLSDLLKPWPLVTEEPLMRGTGIPSWPHADLMCEPAH